MEVSMEGHLDLLGSPHKKLHGRYIIIDVL